MFFVFYLLALVGPTVAAVVGTVPSQQLTLEAADAMAQAAIDEATARQFNDISVTVLDASGRVLVTKTQPGCPRLIPAIARSKAGACIGTNSNSRALKEKYLPERQAQLLSMTTIGSENGVPFAAVPGGVLCRDSEGVVVGAIGVSGASADEDEHCSVVGGQAVGFQTSPADSPLN